MTSVPAVITGILAGMGGDGVSLRPHAVLYTTHIFSYYLEK